MGFGIEREREREGEGERERGREGGREGEGGRERAGRYSLIVVLGLRGNVASKTSYSPGMRAFLPPAAKGRDIDSTSRIRQPAIPRRHGPHPGYRHTRPVPTGRNLGRGENWVRSRPGLSVAARPVNRDQVTILTVSYPTRDGGMFDVFCSGLPPRM